jgi:putative heme-binding domain-containing protein
MATRTIPANPEAAPAQRTFVKEWTVADIEGSLGEISSGRDFKRGQAAFVATQCGVCHQIANTPAQGGVGPDLTSIAARFRRRDILESIIEPSKVVSEQFQDTMIRTKAGEPYVGKLIEDTDERVVIQTNPMLPQRVELKRSEIDSRRPSPLSPMPTGLINILSKDEILDMIAYLEAGGKADHPDFAK